MLNGNSFVDYFTPKTLKHFHSQPSKEHSCIIARCHSLVVKAHDQEVVGSNPGTIYWMDVSDLLAITLKEKLENKGSQMGHTKNTF